MAPDEIGKNRSEAAIRARGISGEEAVGPRTVGRLNGRICTLQHFKTPRAEGAGRAAAQVAGGIAGVAAIPLAAAALTGAAVIGGLTGGPLGIKRATGKVIQKGESFYKGVRDLAKPGDYGHLGQVAKRAAGVVATLPLAPFGLSTLELKSVREGFMHGHGEILTEATFAEHQRLAESDKAEIQKTGYNKYDYKSVARFLNERYANGETFTEGGHILFVDEKNKKILFAEKSADGRVVVTSARCMTVTRRSYSKDESVSIRELYRYARAYALCYDELKESCSDLINKMSGEQLHNSVNSYLSKLDGKMRSIQDRKLLLQFTYNIVRSEDKEARFEELRDYFNRAGLALAGEGVTADSIHFNDDELEKEIRQELATNEPDQLRDALQNYIERHLQINVGDGLLSSDQIKEKVLAYLNDQENRRKIVDDHLKSRIMEDTGIAVNSEADARTALAALDQKLGRMAATLCPNGVDELEAIKALIDDPNSEVATAYKRRLGLDDQPKVDEYLKQLRSRYHVGSNDELTRKLGTMIGEIKEIFIDSGYRNLEAQWYLLEAQSGADLTDSQKAIVTEYLRKEGILKETQTGVIQDFQRDADIDQGRFKLHIYNLQERYGFGEERLNTLTIQAAFANCFTGGRAEQMLEVLGNRDSNSKGYLLNNGIMDRSGGISMEKAQGHLEMLRMHYRITSRNPADLKSKLDREIDKIEIAQGDPSEAFKRKINALFESREGLMQAALTPKTQAQEKIFYMNLLKDAWQITNGTKTAGEFSAQRLEKLRALLQGRGAEIPDDDSWVNNDAFRETVQAALNSALEEDAYVINLGGDEANSHVMQRLNEKIREQQNILDGRQSGYDIQINQHKEALKERLVGENAVMNAQDATIKLELSRIYDPGSNSWKKDAYNIMHTYKMSKGIKKSVHELWSDKDREIVPQSRDKEKKRR